MINCLTADHSGVSIIQQTRQNVYDRLKETVCCHPSFEELDTVLRAVLPKDLVQHIHNFIPDPLIEANRSRRECFGGPIAYVYNEEYETSVRSPFVCYWRQYQYNGHPFRLLFTKGHDRHTILEVPIAKQDFHRCTMILRDNIYHAYGLIFCTHLLEDTNEYLCTFYCFSGMNARVNTDGSIVHNPVKLFVTNEYYIHVAKTMIHAMYPEEIGINTVNILTTRKRS